MLDKKLSRREHRKLSLDVLALLIKAGEFSLHAPKELVKTYEKKDGSAVTTIDLALSRFFITQLEALTGHPVVSEENIDEFTLEQRQALTNYWLVDPLDGTKGYAKERSNYCHMVSFISEGESIFAAIYLPQTKEYVFGGKGYGVETGEVEIYHLMGDILLNTEEYSNFLEAIFEGVLDFELKYDVIEPEIIDAESFINPSDLTPLLVETKEPVPNLAEALEFYREVKSVAQINQKQLKPNMAAVAQQTQKGIAYYSEESKEFVDRFKLKKPSLFLTSGSSSHVVYKTFRVPLCNSNLLFDDRYSAGVKTFKVLTRPDAGYLLTANMSAWDLAPAACLLAEVGGGVFDLGLGKFLPQKLFARDSLVVTPSLLLANKDLLPYFLDLPALAMLDFSSLILSRLQETGEAQSYAQFWNLAE